MYYFIRNNVNYKKEENKNGSKYFKNNEELKNEKDKAFTENEFKTEIKEELHNFFGHYENIVLFIGAGGSIVGKKDPHYGKTMEELAKLVKKSLKGKEFYSIKQLATRCKFEIGENGDYNLEDFLSKLQAYLNFAPANAKDKIEKSYEKILQTIIDNTSYDYDEKVFKHGKLIKQLNDLLTSPNRLSIVTTNYDTVIEQSAYELRYTVFDGFTFSDRPVFDLDMFNWNLSRNIDSVVSKKEIYKKNVIELLKIHGSLTWQFEHGEIVRREKCAIDNPLMIFPSSNKYMQTYTEPYFELFTKFQELINKKNTLLITTGFSFADTHISKMILQAIKTVPSLSVLFCDYTINLDSEEDNENIQALKALMNKSYNIAFLKATIDTDLTEYLSLGGVEND